jgi:hypothetical protein
MTREEAYRLAMRACEETWNEKTCKQIKEALEQTTWIPCPDNDGERELLDRAVKALEAELATKTCNKQIVSKLENVELARDSEKTCNNKQVSCKLVASEDAISRADAETLFRNARGELHKSAIRNEQNGHPIKDLPTRDLMLLNAEQMIHLLPSVTPKQEPCKDVVSRGVFEQVMWERDVAIEQLKELGYGFGEKPRTGHWIETAEEYYKAVNEYGGGVNEDTPYFVNDIACSECLSMFSVIDNETERFDCCPHCGTKMVEPQESEG